MLKMKLVMEGEFSFTTYQNTQPLNNSQHQTST